MAYADFAAEPSSARETVFALLKSQPSPTMGVQTRAVRHRQEEKSEASVIFARQKRMRILSLTVVRGGPRLESGLTGRAPTGAPQLAFVLSPTIIRLPARHPTLADFASILQRSPLDRPVVDQTGLVGKYDFTWSSRPMKGSGVES
jgi:hypothetical protein